MLFYQNFFFIVVDSLFNEFYIPMIFNQCYELLTLEKIIRTPLFKKYATKRNLRKKKKQKRIQKTYFSDAFISLRKKVIIQCIKKEKKRNF